MDRPTPDSDLAEEDRSRQHLADLAAEIAPLLAVEQRLLRRQMRLLWACSDFTEPVLQQMLRGQVLTPVCSSGGPPCLASGEPQQVRQPRAQSQPDWKGSLWPVLRRCRPQTHLCGGPLAPVPWPRNTLLCPLHERALAGDPLVPCPEALQMLPQDMAPATSPLSMLQQGGPHGSRPCQLVHAMLPHVMPAILDGGSRAELEALAQQPPAAIRAQARELAQQEESGEDPTVQELRRQVRFLLGTGRLGVREVDEIAERGGMVTDTGWLPCGGDVQRNVWVSLQDWVEAGQGGEPTARSTSRVEAPEARQRCPLQVRGLLGDRAVPCCEALDLAPDAEMIARLLPAERLIPERDRLPVIWDTPAAEPGGPEDPVRTLELRPCYLLGRLLALTLHGALQVYLDQMAQQDHEAELRDQDQDDR